MRVLHFLQDKIDFATFEYSTTEKIIGKWIDGKTIYQKVINFGALPNSTTKTVAHGITGLSFVVNVRGVASNGAGNYLQLGLGTGSANAGITLAVIGNDIYVDASSNRSSYTSAYVVIEYTKT